MSKPLSLDGLSPEAAEYMRKQKEQWEIDEAAGVHEDMVRRIRAQVAAMPKSEHPIEWYLSRRSDN